MATNDNHAEGEEVRKDPAEPKEVVKTGPITEDDVLKDLLSEEPATPPTKEEKPESEIKETKEEETETEIFAKLGDKEFKDKDELLEFASSHAGYGKWITGHLKKLHPDLFNDDGSLKNDELERAVVKGGEKVKEAAETIAEHAETPLDELTDEDKEDIQKAREILKPLGVLFKDDPELQMINAAVKSWQSQSQDNARESIENFQKEHPELANHYAGVAELIDERGYDLERAWKVYKAEHDIEEKPKDGSGADNVIPAPIKRESGNTPSSGKKDVMDELIGLPGFYS